MSTFAVVSLKNQAGTETAFNPTTVDRNSSINVANYAAAGTIYDARHKLSASLQLPTSKSTRAKVKLKLVVPFMSALDPAIKLDESIVNVDFSMPKNAALIDRQNLRAYCADLLTDAMVIAMIENFEGVY
jgi:hypothetical protein